jgi:hypothetical protein
VNDFEIALLGLGFVFFGGGILDTFRALSAWRRFTRYSLIDPRLWRL